MEPSRFGYNNKLFVIGMVCLALGMVLICFSLYLFPYLIFSWVYDVPEFAITFRQWLVEKFAISEAAAGWNIFMMFLIPGLIAGYISYITSNSIDNKIHGLEEPSEEKKEQTKNRLETVTFSSKLLVLIIGAIMLVLFVDWLMFSV
ncbi:transmembrane protein [Legionella birminghamensis]|uniref:Transmembrane protein n=1 Tax=Legionella birminghamensis TaxID=28083 RepID=A0A378I8R3_9GAMM|nr:hypothetical protein [Legionella birminghamensis]KTC69344.1 transmembrane protein [Legionella birminghamensis]STX31607.1 transmembrane protein [Legionella birminghamensis]